MNERERPTFRTDGEGIGLVDGFRSTRSEFRALRKFDGSSPRWQDDEELVVAILFIPSLWPDCWTEFDESTKA